MPLVCRWEWLFSGCIPNHKGCYLLYLHNGLVAGMDISYCTCTNSRLFPSIFPYYRWAKYSSKRIHSRLSHTIVWICFSSEKLKKVFWILSLSRACSHTSNFSFQMWKFSLYCGRKLWWSLVAILPSTDFKACTLIYMYVKYIYLGFAHIAHI